ncbi:GAF domain-containing protein [Nocardia sp. NPDC004722]
MFDIHPDPSELVPAPAGDQPATPGTGESVASRWGWVVIDTMDGPENASVVLDGDAPREFSRLNRSSIARVGSVARRMEPLIRDVYDSGRTRSKYVTLTDERVQHLIGVPVLGPAGVVQAIAMWCGNISEPLPRIPVLGAAEWDGSGIVSANPAAMFLLRTPAGDALTGHTIPEILAGFESIDHHGFLAMFNLPTVDTPADRWSGTAVSRDEYGERHHVFIAARATHVRGERRVRAVVADVSASATPGRPDLALAAVRHMPIPPGHALALLDLKTGFIHEWLVSPTSPLAAWRHHNPEFHEGDKLAVVNAVFALAAGVEDTATTRARVRFAPGEDWMLLDAKWTRILDGDRPQALLDITPMGEIPVPVVRHCKACQEMANQANKSKPRH